MIKEITQYIENLIGDTAVLEIGTNLFAGTRDTNAPNNCVAVLETPVSEVSFYLTDFAAKVVQVLVRNQNYHVARDLSEEIFALLHGKAGISLPQVDAGPEYFANTIEARGKPAPLTQDERGLYEFVTTYIFRIQDDN